MEVSETEPSDLEIVKSCFFLLKSNPTFHRRKRKWSEFISKYLDHKSDTIKWFACQCIGLLLQMTESQLKSFTNSIVGLETNERFSSIYIHLPSPSISRELERHLDQSLVFANKTNNSYSVTNICGINIPSLSDKIQFKNDLIMVDSSFENLKKIALGLTTGRAICLQGTVGSGKTCLVEYLAGKTGRKLGEDFVKIQLSDETDSKMLLGTYRCTDVPGEFIWQPGVLTQAVIGGHWLLLEDIDLASMDIASVLSNILENGTLCVPGYSNSLEISSGFQLFVTQRLISTSTGNHRKHSNALKLLEKHMLQIHIDPLTATDLKKIVTTKYPQFTHLSDRMINVLNLSTGNAQDAETSITSKTTGRLTSTRDFFKWCFRAAIDFDVASEQSHLKVLHNAIDVFCGSFHDPKTTLVLAKQISAILGIVVQKAEYFLESYKPTMKLNTGSLVVGRASMKRNSETLVANQNNFYFTRLSAVLLERIMCCVNLKEPVLLVGETGTGKTSSIQYLANTLGQKLVVINMNQQSDSADLLGGFKPVDFKFIVSPIKRQFEHIFGDFFKIEPNRTFLGHITYCFNEERWSDLVQLMTKSYEAAIARLSKIKPEDMDRKNLGFLKRWQAVGEKIKKLDLQLRQKTALAFSFIEGSLVKAVEKGYWVLLDEINLANADTLECLSGLLENSRGSLALLERGDKKPVKRHPNFTLFACMNPSTDIGKKELPAGLRNRFTEFFVEELTDQTDLLLLVNKYLEAQSLKKSDASKIVKFYLKVRKATEKTFCDGLGHSPHFSLRTLCRALMITSRNPCGMFKKSLYEAFCLSFLTQLDANSYTEMERLISSCLIGDEKAVKAVLKQPIPPPRTTDSDSYLKFEGYWIRKGNLECSPPDNYILSESVRKNLRDLVRIVSIGKLPVLLQGDTSVGKTSLITYLAKSSGNKCVRINNHEHTDLQEYIGAYVADSTGKLVFREGLLVEAMRQGHWIILDELNLAPTEVLEALNRVLDDNRELYIPETQETVKADPNFMLFATQNPPGSYGGRKILSRAFRNRFVELHFNEIPREELAFILHKRCEMSLSYAKKMVGVMVDLQTRRKGSAAFAGKQGFITLRDLFRWGERYHLAENRTGLYDWDQHLADEGYLVLAGRVRKKQEKEEIIQVLHKHLKREVNPYDLFTLSENTSVVTKDVLQKIHANQHKFPNIVWTYNMRQLAVMVMKAFQLKEPVLLVGETGGGKTSVCKIIAEQNGQELVTVNCHMNSESSDFIGGLRPVRDHSGDQADKLFEWVNGPLIQAMSNGSIFLADEISLVDDSVLERLNSLLEPERTILIAEKGSDIDDPNNSEVVTAHPNFYFIGTMNPGGDFGKKELSPALRNRFTEIWCDPCTERDDLIAIIQQNLKRTLASNDEENVAGKERIAISIIDFIDWFKKSDIGARFTISIRDILTWVNFINICDGKLSLVDSYIHGAFLTFLDGLGSGLSGSESWKSLETFKAQCLQYLSQQVNYKTDTTIIDQTNLTIEKTDLLFGIKPFYTEIGNDVDEAEQQSTFAFDPPTTKQNALRLLRGMQLNKAILLEGSPGVGKTSLVTALAKITRHKVFRVNLSDQTDISDLFGADLPVEGGLGGQFSWKDGPLLQALKQGHWILLDELNLASQSVLEGLNACLDHRGEIFIPELARTFHVKPGTRFFACQNPLKQGGSRRGLPQSFLNRFVQVHMTSLTNEDLFQILQHQFPHLPHDLLIKMLQFNSTVTEELDNHTFGHRGSPWEFNLRDLTRWCEAMIFHSNTNGSGARYQPENCVSLVYRDRMRTLNDKLKIDEIFELVFGCRIAGDAPILYVNDSEVFIGDVSLQRNSGDLSVINKDTNNLVLRSQLQVLRSLAYCVNLNWMSLLVGDSASGKSTVVKVLASLAGKELKTLPVTSSMDTTDILGGFEQTDYTRHLDDIVKETELLVIHTLQKLLSNGEIPDALGLLCLWEDYSHSKDSNQTSTMEEETKLFLNKINNLNEIWKKIYKLDNSAENDLENLKNSARTLSDNLRQEGSINAGGKFEWIDSVLIKCLQNGHWLLLDNVNLCSPAVLDRLNALLEPRGVLTVGERGVDRHGQMVTVKPHPDFRLFFTMDPKNGEISRAMRNRGVEIYMLSNKEADRTDEYDLKSLISLQGLTDNHLTSALLILHNSIKDMISTEEPNISELVRVSTLISHHLRHEKDVHKVFAKNLIEVYYKSRLPNEFKCSDFVEFITRETRTAIDETRRQDGKLQLYDDRVTLKTNNLQLNAVLERVRQQGSLLSAIFEQSQAQRDSRSISDYLTWMLVNFYSITSARDLNARRSHLQNILTTKNSTTDNENCQSISDALCKFVQTTDMCAGDFPLDCRWIPETVTAGKFPANSAILGLYLIACLSREQHQTSAENKANNTRNLLTYMHNKRKNTSVNLDQFDNVLVDNFLSLLEKFDRFLLTLTLESARIDDKELVEILHLLSWRFHLYRCALVSIKKLTDSQRYLIEMNLKVHYCWFFKYSVVKVSTILNRDVPEDLKRITDSINRDLTDAFGALHKLGRNYQKLTLAPLPFVSEAEIQWSLVAKKIVDSYNICNKSNNVLRILEVFLSDATIREQLIEIITAGVDDPADSERLEVLQQKLIEQTTDDLGKNHSQVQLMSFDDCFSQRTVRQAFASLNENTEIPRNWTLPVDLVTLLSLRAQNPRSKPKLDKSFYCYLMNSPSKWNLFDADEDELTATSGLTDYNPLLTRHLINVLVSHDSVITTYGNFRQSARQHEHMSWTLWRNLPQLCHRESDLLWQESELLRADFHSFLLELCDSLKISSETSDRESTRICLDKLRNSLSDRPAEKMFIGLLTICAEKILDFDTVQDLDLRMLDISSVHMELSYLKTLLNSQLTPIDPSAKTKLKKKYVKESISNFDQMRLSFVHLNEVYSGNDKTLHALHGPVVEIIDGLKAKHAQLEDYAAVRPSDVSYESVIRVINRGFSTILSPKFVKNLIQDLNEQTKGALLQDPGFSLDAAHAVYKKYSTTVLSYENIIHEWAKYSTYPDIIEPLVANLAQFLYGLSSSLNLLKKACAGYEFAKRGRHLKEVLECLVKVPTLDQKCIKYEDHVEHYTDKRMYATLYGLLDHGVAERQMLRLYKCGVQETYNQCVISSDEILKSSTFQRFDNLLRIFVDTWNGQEQKRERMKEDENALYKTKTKCDEKTDEEQNIDEMKKLFPNYHVKDFSDIQVSTVLDDDPPEDITETESLDLLSSDDLKFVIDFHVSLLKSFTQTEWLLSSSKIAKIDVVGPLMEKFKVFKDIFNGNVHQIDYTMDKNLLGSLNILLNHVTNHERGSDSSTEKKYYNFYKDPNVEEVKSSQHILVELVSRIKQLLEQWPDQPTLVTILNVIDRIYSFDITSPLPRFLTGFEILLTKCNEWEQVAHSGVSLCEHTQNLIRQIIAWRKIELAEWKNLMNSTFDRFNEPMYKWWIYLYNIMKQFTASDSTDDVQQLIETLQKFMAHSNLGEFQSRLDLLFVFHCHAIHLERSEKVDTFINVMWNLYRYFEQFSSQVAKRIKVLRMPVEKKLKDYVKIVRWKDINYWTVKETVDKSHKILHKFVRDFQDVLRQPVLSCLVNNTTSDKKEDLGIWDEPQKQPVHYTLDVSAYLAKEPLRKITPSETTVIAEKPISSKLEAYSKKSRTLCKNVILKTKYPHLVQSLDDVIGDVIDTSSYLRDLEVDRTLPKEKQKSQAKSILQQKHRGLSDLFKTLSKIGLSYQTGIVEANLKRAGEDFLLKPIDLSASFKHLNRKNENLRAIWESCETYYLRSLMRFDVLETALRSSAPDLGMQNVERCRGFSSHALVYIKQQKQDLISSSRQFYYLRHYLAKITGVCEKPEFIHIKTFKHIQQTLRSVIMTMTQFRAILDTRPKEIFTTSDSSPEIVELASKNGPFNYFNSDSVWDRSNICVTETLAACKDVLGILEKHQRNVPSHDFELNQLEFIPVPEFGSILMKLSAIDLRTSELFRISEHLPISGSLRWLLSELHEIRLHPDEGHRESSEAGWRYSLEHQVEKLCRKILMIIQNLYKKYETSERYCSDENDSQDTQVEENHLRVSIMENLSKDVGALEMNKVLKTLHKVTKILFGLRPDELNECKPLMLSCVPLLEQLMLLYEYFLTQQVLAYRVTCKMTSIILNIFIELVSKGFCVPPDLAEDAQSEGASKPSDGMGLGDGKGERDVSDRIESEDQLDEAQPAGSEKKDQAEDEKCPEEEKAIEMSEDFEGELQDKKPKEDDSEDSDNSDSDAEEQMGETEKNADKLDQQIWGSDDEKEEGEGDDDTGDEEEGSGETIGEKQLAAKEKDEKPKNKDKKEDPSKDDKHKNQDEDEEEGEEGEPKKEIDEMREPEYEDQMDPHHLNLPEPPEPEPMDLPDDLEMGGEEDEIEKDEENDEKEGDNPFDIDEMKEQNPFEKKDKQEADQDEKQRDDEAEFSGDDEDIRDNKEDQNKNEAEEKEDEVETNEDGKAQPEQVIEENEKEEDEPMESNVEENDENTAPDQSKANEDKIEGMDVDTATAADKVESTPYQNQTSDQAMEDEFYQEEQPDQEGVGQSQMQEDDTGGGHTAQTVARLQNMQQQNNKRQRDDDVNVKQKPGESDSQRSLGNVDEPVMKKLKALDDVTAMNGDDTEEGEKGPDEDEEEEAGGERSKMYEHVKEAESSSAQVLDVATKEQTEAQKKELSVLEEKEEEDKTEIENMEDAIAPEKDEDVEIKEQNKQLREDVGENRNKKDKKANHQPEGDISDEPEKMEIEGEFVKTLSAWRGDVSTFSTGFKNISSDSSAGKLSIDGINSLRADVQRQLSHWTAVPSDAEAQQAWHRISSVTLSMAQDLSEQLRLVLEPTKATRLKGDFRTGRRINMRKVIPYIASQFRKDKIWLRRSKPSKRNYQIVLALDDSASMCANNSKEMAFESVAMISKALTLLESGRLGVVSFGKETRIVHRLGEPFTEMSGTDLMKRFKFDQEKTHVDSMVEFVTEMFSLTPNESSAPNANLLVIVGDGLGVSESCISAVRRAKLANVFIIFVIIDNQENEQSILDLTNVVFKDKKVVELRGYMDDFPFDFYIVLKNINSLPNVLSDALRQWFEVVSNLDRR